MNTTESDPRLLPLPELRALRTQLQHDDDAVNAERITELTSNDWGLQRTFEMNLDRLREGLPEQPLEPDLQAAYETSMATWGAP